MRNLKKIWLIITFILIINVSYPIYADDEIEETGVTPEEIEEIIEATSEVSDIPSINSRNAIIYDRSSRKDIIWKK